MREERMRHATLRRPLLSIAMACLSLLPIACQSSSSSSSSSSTTYTVGGTLSGLTADGLVLQDNGDDNLTLSANATAFTFATSLASGAAYAVTVLTQPTGLTCTVNNGSGTVAAANVTNVSVACSVNAYTVGGSISGLTTGGLVLQDNGGDNLTIPANAASFTFATPVADGANYTVTVLTQATGLTCTVNTGSGTVAAANVTNVSVVCSVNAYTVGGTISNLTAGGLVLQDNGGDNRTVLANATSFTFATPVAYGASYNVTVKTQPTGLTCKVSNGSGTMGAGNVTSVSVACSVSVASPFTTGQAATLVLGQPTFGTSETPCTTTGNATALSTPRGVIVVGTALYVVSLSDHRVMVWSTLPTSSNAPASFVLGQTTPTTKCLPEDGGYASATGLDYPTDVASDGTHVAVSGGDGRVMLWNALPTVSDAPANLSVGMLSLTQANFTSPCNNSPSYPTSYFGQPQGLTFAGAKLLVADGSTNRVLIWSPIPTAMPGSAAALILGQADGVTCTANRGGAASAATLNYPQGMWSNGTKLAVADTDNNRVLIWNTFPTTTGQAADLVLGQPDFTTVAATATQTGMNTPQYVTSNGTLLFVADGGNNRVLIWNTFPTQNGQAADVVLGQTSFTGNGSGGTAAQLAKPTGVAFDGTNLWVTEQNNNRVVRY